MEIKKKMSKDYEEYEDYEPGGFQKNSHGKKKGKRKGHQGRSKSESEIWLSLIESDDGDQYNDTKPTYQPRQSAPSVRPQTPVQPLPSNQPVAPKPFVFGPNTHEIRGVQIDFDRVQNIENIDGEHNGRMTFGIKFLFTGNKGLSRIIWFNVNQRERDRVFAEEYKFWLSLKEGK